MSREEIANRYDDAIARLRIRHRIGKPCPRKPWMLFTTLDHGKGRCGACGEPVGEEEK